MREHNMLVAQPDLRADMERSVMSADHRDDRRRTRAGGIALFRRGAATALAGAKPTPAMVQRRPEDIFSAPLRLPLVNPARVWESLNPVVPDAEWLRGNGLFPDATSSPAVAAFDVLRTRILQALSERGWNRVAITSPTHGCGKSFVAANLALSLARRPASRTVLLDLDLRNPGLARLLGLADVPPLREFLFGEQPLESHFIKFGKTLALGLNGAAEADPGAILHHPDLAQALEAVQAQLEPEVILMDMPPALGSDEVIAMQPQTDALLLVTDGTHSSPDEIRACERLFADRIPILGVVLNRAQDRPLGRGRKA